MLFSWKLENNYPDNNYPRLLVPRKASEWDMQLKYSETTPGIKEFYQLSETGYKPIHANCPKEPGRAWISSYFPLHPNLTSQNKSKIIKLSSSTLHLGRGIDLANLSI